MQHYVIQFGIGLRQASHRHSISQVLQSTINPIPNTLMQYQAAVH